MMSMPILIIFILIFGLHFARSNSGNEWSYKGDNGPEHWSEKFKHCGGTKQSPIAIVTSDVIYDSNLGLFEFHNYTTVANVSLDMNNNGHTVQVDLGNEDLSISSAGLNDSYHAAQFHFHWGLVNQRGSEHDFNGNFLPMEMHIVHYSDKYPSIDEAIAEENGLAVLGFLFEIGDHNEHFDTVISHFSEIEHQDNTTNIHAFALMSLLPEDLSVFYRYYGSLTTPPCYESVVWTVFQETIKVSKDQMETFRQKIHHDVLVGEETVSDDYRPTQSLNGRNVYTNDPSGVYNGSTFVQPFPYLALIFGICALFVYLFT